MAGEQIKIVILLIFADLIVCSIFVGRLNNIDNAMDAVSIQIFVLIRNAFIGWNLWRIHLQTISLFLYLMRTTSNMCFNVVIPYHKAKMLLEGIKCVSHCTKFETF